MNAIWKFSLQIIGINLIKMPDPAKILSTDIQYGYIMIWVMVDTETKSSQKRKIVVHPTGNSPESIGGEFVGTVQEGGFVWHVFDEGPVSED